MSEFKLFPTDFKFVEAGKVMAFAGYASQFNGLDAYGDTIAPGAYKETIANRDRPLLMKRNHFEGVIGKWIELREDDYGLYVEGELTPGHSKAQDTYALMKHGAVNGLSIGFVPVETEMRSDNTRLIKKIDLLEISVVDTPADRGAQITSVKEAQSLKQIEAILRQRFTRSEATAIVAQIKSLSHGDRDDQGEAMKEALSLIRNFKLI